MVTCLWHPNVSESGSPGDILDIMTLDGSGALPGFVNVYEGTINIHLD